jgi:hypothetical protein
MMIIESDKWMEAPFDIEVVDVWPPGRLSDAAKDAYDKLARAGRIRPVSARRDATGRTVVRYMADCPEVWIREELREAKYAGRQMNMNEVRE